MYAFSRPSWLFSLTRMESTSTSCCKEFSSAVLPVVRRMEGPCYDLYISWCQSVNCPKSKWFLQNALRVHHTQKHTQVSQWIRQSPRFDTCSATCFSLTSEMIGRHETCELQLFLTSNLSRLNSQRKRPLAYLPIGSIASFKGSLSFSLVQPSHIYPLNRRGWYRLFHDVAAVSAHLKQDRGPHFNPVFFCIFLPKQAACVQSPNASCKGEVGVGAARVKRRLHWPQLRFTTGENKHSSTSPRAIRRKHCELSPSNLAAISECSLISSTHLINTLWSRCTNTENRHAHTSAPCESTVTCTYSILTKTTNSQNRHMMTHTHPHARWNVHTHTHSLDTSCAQQGHSPASRPNPWGHNLLLQLPPPRRPLTSAQEVPVARGKEGGWYSGCDDMLFRY